MTETVRAQISFIKDCICIMDENNLEDLRVIMLDTLERLNDTCSK